MPVASVRGADIYYEVHGSGPALLFIAGAFSDVKQFGKVVPLLADEFTCVTYDRRGYSRSNGFEDKPTTSVPDEADDAAALLEVLSVSPAAVYGISSGAIIALDLVIRYPAAVRAAILHEPPLNAVVARPDDVGALIGEVIGKGMAAGGPPAAAEAFIRWVGGEADWASLDPGEQEQIRKNAGTFFGYEVPAAMVAYRPDDATLAAVSIPIQVLVSEQSHPFFTEASEWLAGRLRTKISRTPGTHTAFLGRPAELARNIRAFLNSVNK